MENSEKFNPMQAAGKDKELEASALQAERDKMFDSFPTVEDSPFPDSPQMMEPPSESFGDFDIEDKIMAMGEADKKKAEAQILDIKDRIAHIPDISNDKVHEIDELEGKEIDEKAA